MHGLQTYHVVVFFDGCWLKCCQLKVVHSWHYIYSAMLSGIQQMLLGEDREVYSRFGPRSMLVVFLGTLEDLSPFPRCHALIAAAVMY